MPERPIRILIADDDARVRHGLRALIHTQPGWTVVGEAASKPEVLRLVQATQADMIILDLRLPGAGDGLELTRILVGERRRPVLAMSIRGGLREAALTAGAHAFVEKGADTDTLVNALQSVVRASERLGSP